MSKSVNGTGARNGAPENYNPFTLKDTGEVVYVGKVNPLLVREITRNFPPPKPPINRIQYGDQWVDEPNESDPLYERALQQHNEEVNSRLINLMIKRGVWIDWNDEKSNQVSELREDMLELGKTELPKDDKLVWVLYIAVGTPEDMEELITAITTRSQPTERAISENLAAFRD